MSGAVVDFGMLWSCDWGASCRPVSLGTHCDAMRWLGLALCAENIKWKFVAFGLQLVSNCGVVCLSISALTVVVLAFEANVFRVAKADSWGGRSAVSPRKPLVFFLFGREPKKTGCPTL